MAAAVAARAMTDVRLGAAMKHRQALADAGYERWADTTAGHEEDRDS